MSIFDIFNEIDHERDWDWIFRAFSLGTFDDMVYYLLVWEIILSTTFILIQKIKDFTIEDIDYFIDKIRKHKFYGGNLELVEFCELLKINIFIYDNLKAFCQSDNRIEKKVISILHSF